MKKKLIRFCVRLVISTTIVAVFFISIQDFLLFPGLTDSLFQQKQRDPASLPAKVHSIFLDTPDQERIEVWYYPATSERFQRRKVALLFHGNAGKVDNFFDYQRWLAHLGIESYALEYRGFGFSTGWPRESVLNQDAELLWNYVRKENPELEDEDMVVMGLSVGSGLAAYIAARFHPRALVFLAPYTSIPDLVREMPLYKYLTPFVWNIFPVREYVGQLEKTCVVAAHGEMDQVIGFSHLDRVLSALAKDVPRHRVAISHAGHNDLMRHAGDKMAKALLQCLQN